MMLKDELARIYGAEGFQDAGQLARYSRALDGFREVYGPGEVSVFRAPGRVNLIGEHTDYNHGYVLPVALDRDVLVLARRRQDRQIRLANSEERFEPHSFVLSRVIPNCQDKPWVNYVQGPAQWLARRYGDNMVGMDVLVDGRYPWGVPRGAGLSSSSALVVAAAVAMVALNDIRLSGAALADACGQAEWYVGTRGGVMDQFIALLGGAGQALFLDCRPDVENAYRWRRVSLLTHHQLFVIDSGVKHRNTSNAFNQRVAECRIGTKLLAEHVHKLTHLRDAESLGWDQVAGFLPETMTMAELVDANIDLVELMAGGALPNATRFHVRKRCRHVITENARVLDAVDALDASDDAKLVALLAQAHVSARDDYEISVPEVEAIVDLVTGLSDRIGARLTGAGWGGCVVALCPDDLVTALQATLSSHHIGFFSCHAASGAGLAFHTTV